MARVTPLAALVLDWSLYPRHDVDQGQVGYMVEALRAGHELPPIVADKVSLRIIDGFHRYRAFSEVLGKEASIPVVLKPYTSEAEMFEDAMRYNASHGKNLTTFDRARCMMIAERLEIQREKVGEILHWRPSTEDRIERTRYSGTLNGRDTRVPLKRTIEHMAGAHLTERQLKANGRLSGMKQAFYVNQLVELLEGDLVDTENDALMLRLEHLNELLAAFLSERTAA